MKTILQPKKLLLLTTAIFAANLSWAINCPMPNSIHIEKFAHENDKAALYCLSSHHGGIDWVKSCYLSGQPLVLTDLSMATLFGVSGQEKTPVHGHQLKCYYHANGSGLYELAAPAGDEQAYNVYPGGNGWAVVPATQKGVAANCKNPSSPADCPFDK